MPPQPLPRFRAGSRRVQGCERREPAEVVGRLLGSLADDRHVQPAADDACDLVEWHSLVGDRVIPGSRRTLLQGESVDTGGIEPVDGRPAVEPIPHIGRDALFPRKTDEVRNEAVITVSMNRWRKAYDGYVHAL